MSDMTAETMSERRTITWKLVHSRKNPETGQREFPSEEARKIVERIDELNEQVTQGSWNPERHDDQLSRALGKKDHPGRATGFGGHVSIRQAFGNPGTRAGCKGNMISYEEHARLIAELEERNTQRTAQLKEELMNEVLSQIRKEIGSQEVSRPTAPTGSPTETTPIGHSSVHSVNLFPYADLEKPVNCQLLMPHGGQSVIVAFAQLFKSAANDVVNDEVLRSSHAKVRVDDFVAEHADRLLPVPVVNKYTTIRSAHSSMIQWPVRWIQIDKQSVNDPVADKRKKKTLKVSHGAQSVNFMLRGDLVYKKIQQTMTPHLKNLYNVIVSLPPGTELFKVSIEENVIHVPGGKVVDIWIHDMVDVFKRDWLDVSIIESTIPYLSCVEGKTLGVNQHFGFLSPSICCPANASSDLQGLMNYVISAVKKCRTKSYLLLPYHEEKHWSLIVFCMENPRVLYFNSIETNTRQTSVSISAILTNAFTRALSECQIQIKIRPLQWHTIDCAKQPGGSECGYYVIRYMYDIMSAMACVDDYTLEKALSLVIGEKSVYTKSSIDYVLERWANYISGALYY